MDNRSGINLVEGEVVKISIIRVRIHGREDGRE